MSRACSQVTFSQALIARRLDASHAHLSVSSPRSVSRGSGLPCTCTLTFPAQGRHDPAHLPERNLQTLTNSDAPSLRPYYKTHYTIPFHLFAVPPPAFAVPLPRRRA